jgi:4-aminobutyrate aminotransferase
MIKMKKSAGILARDAVVMSPSLTRDLPFVFREAHGCHMWDADGKKYLDFTACIAVNSIGHDNPVIRKAILKQIKYGIHCAFSDFYAEEPVALAEKLLALMPGFQKVFLCNSGTESVEAAYKLARWHSDRTWTIAFQGAFHGRTMGALSMTNSKPVQRERFGPFLPVVHVPYPYAFRMGMEPEDCAHHCLGLLEDRMSAMRDDLSAVFMEPVLGEGGYVVPPAAFVRGVRKLCNEYGALLCDDEVQAGCFRTGKFLAIENFGVKPDIVSLSKAIGGGIPLGAMISTERTMDWPPGAHANTFGGNLLACAAGIATLDFMARKKLGDNAVKMGKLLMKGLESMKGDDLVDVRGMGLMIGLEISGRKERADIMKRALDKGLVLLPAGESAIRICPPLTITRGEAEKGLEILEECL